MSDKLGRLSAILIFFAVIAFAIGFYSNRPDPVEYSIEVEVVGVNVKSQIPLEQVSQWRDLRFFESDDTAIISCNLELRAIKPGIVNGLNQVFVEYGPQGIEIQERKAFIRGQSESHLLQSCHAFACITSGVDCPRNLMYARGIIDGGDALRIVLDGRASASAVGAYTELIGALSFVQAKHADFDKNGVLDDWEIERNTLHIMPYIENDDRCQLQPLNNLIQTTEGSNDTVDCANIRGIHVREGGANKIEVSGGDRIIISGDTEHLLIESIIVGNVIAPEWIAALHRIR